MIPEQRRNIVLAQGISFAPLTINEAADRHAEGLSVTRKGQVKTDGLDGKRGKSLVAHGEILCKVGNRCTAPAGAMLLFFVAVASRGEPYSF